MSDPKLPHLLRRHWTEYVSSMLAIVIAAISLWIAIDAENTNRQLVQAASWPFLQIYSSDVGGKGQREFSVDLKNAGVGPAKIETFELFWGGKAYRSSSDLLRDCCGYHENSTGEQSLKTPVPAVTFATSTSVGLVMRPGDVTPIIAFAETPENIAMWNALNTAGGKFNYRACYCSVFNQCWLSDGKNPNPPRVTTCPQPKVPYTE